MAVHAGCSRSPFSCCSLLRSVFDMTLKLLAAALLLWSPIESGASWDYAVRGPSVWHKVNPVCRGKYQSPIDIHSTCLIRRNNWTPLRLSTQRCIKTKLSNKGLALYAGLDSESVVQLTGGPLGNEVYRVAQFHIHFSVDGPTGSEHTIDGVQTEAEIHIVTFNSKYGTLGNAVSMSDGLAVIGAMIESGHSTHSDDLKEVFNQSANLNFQGDSTSLSVALQNLLPHDFHSNFYTYNGSLTTPPCSESVTWLLARRTIKIHPQLIKGLSYVFTGANESDPGMLMSGNYRPVQPLFGRRIYYMDLSEEMAKEAKIASDGATMSAPFIILPLAILSLLAAFRL